MIVKRLLKIALLFVILMSVHLEVAVAGSGIERLIDGPPAILEDAAGRNTQLKYSTSWYFGGKSQRGWYLYSHLIANLLEVEADPETPEFARGVYRWQQSRGMNATGVLDGETWMAMVRHFQDQRLNGRSGRQAGNMIMAAPSDFFDPERPRDLRYVDGEAYQAYKKMIEAAKRDLSKAVEGQSDAPYMKIISAYRSPEYQARLRRLSPKSGRAGLAVNSPHFTGRALDIYVGGEPVSTAEGNRRLQVSGRYYQWLVKNAGRFGFLPYFYEPWHWEYKPAR